MSEKNHNILGKILVPPLIFFAGVMALWENEARFDYASAAREAAVIDTPDGAPAGTVISLSGELDTRIPIEGVYADRFIGYHVVSRLAEIYAWNREDDGDGGVDWSKEWQPRLQNNPRNAGLRQTLASQTLYPPRYRLAELKVDPARIHFVDEYTPIASSGLTLADARSYIKQR